MVKKYDVEMVEHINKAFEAARAATDKYLQDHPGEWYPCGFAWVLIKPARSKVVSYLKDNKIGSSGIYGGYRVYNPSGNNTQCMNAKYAGAVAFADYLASNLGLNIDACQNVD